MGDTDEEKTKSPFDSESEDETIALSMDELDGILSEAEIVQETHQKGGEKGEEEPEMGEELGEQELGEDIVEMDLGEAAGEESMEEISLEEGEEFDISGEIDELSPKDLEDIELEVGDVDTYVQDLEEEFEQKGEISMEEEGPETAEEELEGLEEEELPEEEIDLESLEAEDESLDLEIEEEEIGEEELGELVLGEQELGEQELAEAPFLGGVDEKLEGFDLEDQEAFREAGIEDMEEEVEDLKLPEVPGEEGLPEMEEEELEVPEEALEEIPSLEEEVVLPEEEEEILSKDLDLEAEGEEVVTVTGEELSKLEEEEEKGETITIDSALYNDITTILKYMDTLLGELPEKKIKEFSKSSYFELYKMVFEQLGIS